MQVYHFPDTNHIVVARSPSMAVAFYMEYHGIKHYTYSERDTKPKTNVVAFFSYRHDYFLSVEKLRPDRLPEGFTNVPEGTIYSDFYPDSD